MVICGLMVPINPFYIASKFHILFISLGLYLSDTFPVFSTFSSGIERAFDILYLSGNSADFCFLEVRFAFGVMGII